MRDRRLAILLLFVFIDLLGYSLFLPILPFYADALGAGPALIGLLIASNAVTQFLSGPIFGRLSDRYGRRPLLIVSVAGTLVSFLLLALSHSIAFLFVSRVLDGLLGGDITLARAYITDVTEDRDRARGLGLIGAAFGLGFIIGPALGGTLSNWGLAVGVVSGWGLSRYAVPALCAAALAAINLALVIARLPESLRPEQRAAAAAGDARTRFTARALWAALQRRCVGPLLTTRFFQALAFGLFQANFALYSKYRLGLDASRTSYILTYVGVLVVLVQGVAIGRLSERFGERRLIFAGLALMTLSLFLWALVPNVWLLLVVMAPMALSAGVLNTVLTSYLSKTVYREEVGGTLGLASSLESLSRIIAPVMGGALLQGLGPASLGLAGAAMMLVVLGLAWRQIVTLPEFPLPGCVEELDSA